MKYIFLIITITLSLFLNITSVQGMDSICTEEAKMCDDGRTYVSREGPNCEFKECPSNGSMCTDEYSPVCGSKQVECVTTPCEPIEITYSNECRMLTDGAELLHKGECSNEEEEQEYEDVICTQEAKLCEDGETYVSRGGPRCEFAACPNSNEINCTQEFEPVCGQPVCVGDHCDVMGISLPETFGNQCKLNKSGAYFLYEGICSEDSIISDNELTVKVIDESSLILLDEALDKIQRIIGKYRGNKKEVLIVEITKRINIFKKTYPEYGLWLDYIRDNLDVKLD